MKVYLFRHGETEWSRASRHTGLTDLELTEEGKREAKCLNQGLKFDYVLSSPLKRAKESCILAGYEKEMVLEPALLEWNYGDYEGLTSSQIWEKDPGWTVFTKDPPHGETATEIQKRADGLIRRLKGNKIALFSSAHFLRSFTARWLKLPVSEGKHFSLSTASKSILGFEHDQPSIFLWNDISHLSKLG